jgi:uroporphyrinogen decarboxylase
MTSRERVRLAINFKEADRIPIDWGCSVVSGIHEAAYRNLLDYLGWEEDIIISDPVQRLALPSERMLQYLGVDTRYIFANPPSTWEYRVNEDGSWVDEFGTLYLRTEYYCDFRKYPLEDAETIEDLKVFKLPDPEDPARFKGLREKAKWLYENTDYAIVAGSYPSLYYTAWVLRGYQNFMLDTAADEKFANYILDMIMDWYTAYMGRYLEEIGDYIDIMWSGDDWGDQHGPLINPKEFRKNVVPRFKKIISFMKSKSSAKMSYHCCGSVTWCLDDLYDFGVDIIQPLQANAYDMSDSKRLKQMTYGKLVLHGGLDNQGVFHKSKKEVQESTAQKIRDFKPGGGYLFASGHNIQANCPPENILGLFETYRENCDYGQV